MDTHTKPLTGENAPKSPGKHDPSLRYARRPRHKTREDRYEYKGHEDAKRIQKIGGHNKRSARRKLGAALVEEFQAPNVDTERLTLKQASGPGFLSKGKSSEPTTRRGIPDLTFSEMTFLNRRRDLDDARFRGLTEQERPKKTTKSSAQDVSGFFAQPPQPAQPAPADTAGQGDLCARGKASNGFGHMSVPPRSPRTHALSETSPDQYGTSARTMPQRKAATSAKTWHPDPYESGLQYLKVEGRPSNTDTPADAATSYISWSPSADYEHVGRQRDDVSEVITSPHDQRVVNTRVQDSPHAAHTVHPRSSVSNISRLEKYRLSSYHSAQQRFPKVFYSLDDLKCMAKDLGRVEHEPTQDVPFLRHLPLYKQPHNKCSTLTPRKKHLARELVPPADGVDMRCATSKLAEDAMSEEQDLPNPTTSRIEGGIHRERYGQSRYPSPRFSHAVRIRGFIPTGPTLWKEPSDIAINLPLQYPGSRAEADGRNKFEQQLYDCDNHNYDLTGGRSAPSHEQPCTVSHDVPVVGAGDLDAFDAELLQSAHENNLDFNSRSPSLELLSAPRQRSRPSTECDDRGTKDSKDRHSQEGPRAATIESFRQSKIFEHEGRLRPKLLRPSEDQSLGLEPFTGFSRPCILY